MLQSALKGHEVFSNATKCNITLPKGNRALGYVAYTERVENLRPFLIAKVYYPFKCTYPM